MELLVHPLRLELDQPFTIAHGTFQHRDAVVVELRQDGFSGFGEATAISYYGKSQQRFVEALEAFRPTLSSRQLDHPANLYQHLQTQLADPFLRCALDVAAHDWWAKKSGLPLDQALGLTRTTAIRSNYTISIGPIETMQESVRKHPHPVYKVKLGTEDDLAIIRALRAVTTAIFRVDANAAWSVEKTLRLAPQLRDLGVEFIEQPLPADDWKGAAKLFQKSPLPIIADESCQTAQDVTRCYRHFHGVNVKLMKCGGITSAIPMLRRARFLKMRTMVGCMTETSIGISAIAHLLPLLDYVDMDGALLLKKDPATGVQLKNGRVIFQDKNGHGGELRRVESII